MIIVTYFSVLIRQFVNVEYNQAMTTVLCHFSEYCSNDSTYRSCSVAYGPSWECRNLSLTANSSSTRNNTIEVDLNLHQMSDNDRDIKHYCLQVIAQNGTYAGVLEMLVTLPYTAPAPTTCSIGDLTGEVSTVIVTQLENTSLCGAGFFSVKLSDAIVCYSGTDIGSIAVYFCLSCGVNVVYDSVSDHQSFIRRCMDNGTWNGTKPTCDCSKSILHEHTLSYYTIIMIVHIITILCPT